MTDLHARFSRRSPSFTRSAARVITGIGSARFCFGQHEEDSPFHISPTLFSSPGSPTASSSPKTKAGGARLRRGTWRDERTDVPEGDGREGARATIMWGVAGKLLKRCLSIV